MNTLGVKGSYRLVQEIGKQLGKEGVKLVNEFKNADITKKAEILGRSLTYAVPTKALASGTLKLISKNQVIVKGVKAAKTGAAFIKQKGVVKVTLATPIVGKVGSSSSKIQKASQGFKGIIKSKCLPTKGKIRFVPRPADAKSGKILFKNGGYVDKFGNVWKKPKVENAKNIKEIHWDVQLSKKGKEQLDWLSNSGNHLNVTQNGILHH